MKTISILYILNATLLLLHEIESAYEQEWEILKLPGKISAFLLLHIPIIILIFYGLIEIEKESTIGIIFGVVMGINGIIPFLVHKILFKKAEHFSLIISNIIIYSSILSGIGLLFLSLRYFA